MPEDDPLLAIIARHRAPGRADARSVLSGIDPATLSRICDMALTTLGAVGQLVGLAETALTLQRQRLAQRDTPLSNDPAGRTDRPIRIPIRFHESDN